MNDPRATREHGSALQTLVALGFVVASAFFLLFQIGYGFEDNDQLQYLLLPYRSIYPHFLPGDWFTWQTSHYHQTYAWLIRGLHALSGEAEFAPAVLVAHFGALCALSYALLQLSLSLGYGLWEAVAAVLVLGFLRESALAGSTLNHGRLIPADLALPPFLLACAAWARGRTLATGVWLGISGFFHANFAVLGPLVLGPLVLERCIRERRLSPLLQMAAAYALLAAPTLWLLVGSFLAHDTSPASVGITLFIRSAHHYDLRAMHPEDFYWPLGLAVAGLPAWLSRSDAQPSAARLRLLLALLCVVALGILGAALRVVPLARIFAFRMSVPLVLLLLLALGQTVRRIVSGRDVLSMAWLACALVLVAQFSHLGQAQPGRWGFSGFLYGLPALLPLMAASLCLGWRSWLRYPVVLGALSVALLWDVSIARVPGSEDWQPERWQQAHRLRVFPVHINSERPTRALFSQIRDRTAQDARFLAPPGLIDFRLLARRAVLVDWKCAPMKGDEALEWQRRMLLAMGSTDFPAVGYALRTAADRLYLRRPLAELAALARKQGLTHVLAARRSVRERVPALHLLFTDAQYAVYEVRAPDAR